MSLLDLLLPLRSKKKPSTSGDARSEGRGGTANHRAKDRADETANAAALAAQLGQGAGSNDVAPVDYHHAVAHTLGYLQDVSGEEDGGAALL